MRHPRPLRIVSTPTAGIVSILAADGTQRELLDLMQTRQELYDLLEYDAYEARDRIHFGLEPSTLNSEP